MRFSRCSLYDSCAMLSANHNSSAFGFAHICSTYMFSRSFWLTMGSLLFKKSSVFCVLPNSRKSVTKQGYPCLQRNNCQPKETNQSQQSTEISGSTLTTSLQTWPVPETIASNLHRQERVNLAITNPSHAAELLTDGKLRKAMRNLAAASLLLPGPADIILRAKQGQVPTLWRVLHHSSRS